MSLSVGRNDTRLASYGRPAGTRVGLCTLEWHQTTHQTCPGESGVSADHVGFGTVGDHSTGDQQKIVSIPRFYKDLAGMKIGLPELSGSPRAESEGFEPSSR